MDGDAGKRVCIIGAGLAGLVTAKVLKEDGFEVVVSEKQAELGGVWAASRTYPGLRANNSRESYAFSDYPYPDTADDFPTAEQIRASVTAPQSEMPKGGVRAAAENMWARVDPGQTGLRRLASFYALTNGVPRGGPRVLHGAGQLVCPWCANWLKGRETGPQ